MKMPWVQAVKMCLLAAALSTDLNILTGATNTTEEENCANVTTTCGTDAMTVTVEMEPDFSGEVYAEGFRGGDVCFSYNYDVATGYKVYEHDYYYNGGSCGATWTQKDNETQEFSAVTFIQFDRDIIQVTDIRHRSSCVFPNDQVVSGQLPGMVNGTRFKETNETVRGVLPSLTIVDANGKILNQNDIVVVGDPLEVIVYVTSPPIEKMVVTECLASSRSIERFPFTETLKLTDSDGCPTTTTVLAGTATYGLLGDYVVYSLPIYAFLFVEGLDENNRNQLHFSCKAFLCSTGNDSLCAEPPCDTSERNSTDYQAGGEPTVRRRREAGEEGTKVKGSIQVRMNAEGDTQETDGDKATQGAPEVTFKQCANNPKTQSMLAVFVVVFIGLVMTVVALTCLNHRLRRRLRQTEKREKAGDGLR